MDQPYFATTIGTILRNMPDLQLPPSGASMFKFGQPDVLASAMRDAGFTSVDEKFTRLPWNWPGTPDDLWAYFQEVTVPFKPLLSAIPTDRREQIDARVLDALRERYRDGEVKFDAEIVIVTGATT
jgi:hypothetical protein